MSAEQLVPVAKLAWHFFANTKLRKQFVHQAKCLLVTSLGHVGSGS
jgi:hypothetical protein